MIDYECDNCDDDDDCDAFDDYDDSPGDACAQEAQGRGVGGLSRPGSVKKSLGSIKNIIYWKIRISSRNLMAEKK